MQNANKQNKGIIGSVVNFLGRGWDYVIGPSKSRCNAYEQQIDYAQEQMKREDLSRKDKKFWKKERNAGMNGLADVHNSNNETFIKVICAVGAGLLIGNKLLSSKK